MEKNKLTDKHLCYVVFLEMSPADFISLLETNSIAENIVLLEVKDNLELYQEAKELMIDKYSFDNYIKFDFDVDSEPFIFYKHIGNKIDRVYKICIFEQKKLEIQNRIKTSDIFCEGVPLFFDQEGSMIKISDN